MKVAEQYFHVVSVAIVVLTKNGISNLLFDLEVNRQTGNIA